MQMNIVLNKAHGRIEGDRDVVLSLAENLTLAFSSIYNLRGAAISINGNQYRLNGNSFVVPRHHLDSADLRVTVATYHNGSVDRIFEVEPITLRKLTPNYEAHATFDDLSNRVEMLVQLCNNLQSQINNLTDRISGTELF